MRKTLQKICSLILCLCLVLSVFPTFAWADTSTPETEITETTSPEGENVRILVKNSDELEAAINAKEGIICIAQDFQLDRTFYITESVTIYSYEKHTLTRAKDFASDIFIVGENKDGEIIEGVSFNLGSADVNEADLLTIDGNRDNLEVEVLGSVIFAGRKSIVNIHPDVSIVNNKKLGNEKTQTGTQTVSYPERVGGAVAIICEKAEMNILGGKFNNNSVSDSSTCYQGGAFYNYGVFNIYDGLFDGNTANSGGALYVTGENGREERELEIYNSVFEGNSAKTSGGAVNITSSAEVYAFKSKFNQNTSTNGAAFYVEEAKLETSSSDFNENSSSGSGGAIYVTETGTATLNYPKANGNTSGASGGFAYVATGEINVHNGQITNNTAKTNGGAIHYNNDTFGKIYSTKFKGNHAGSNAGAVGMYTNLGEITIHSSSFIENTADNFGGAIWMSNKSQVYLYNNIAKNNSALYGGFMYETTASTNVYLGGITLLGNTSENGPIIWGNTYNAKFYLDKAKYVDEDNSGAYDDA